MDSLDELKEKLEKLKHKMEAPNWQETIGDEINSELEEFTELFTMSQPKVQLNVKKLHPDAVLPKYNYDGDSGFDFHSTDEITIGPFGRALIPTGLAFDLPTGHELQIRSKSGLAINQGLMVLNSPGTVDCVPEDTLIKTINGEITVKEIFNNKIKQIFSFNDEIFQIEEDFITEMWIVDDVDCLTIETESGAKVTAPLEKEIYTKRGWVKMKELTIDDEVMLT